MSVPSDTSDTRDVVRDWPDRPVPQLLVVGDSTAAAEAAALLRADGVETIAVANETEALLRHPAMTPDVVVLTEAAAGGTTAELVLQLRSHLGEPPAVVVLVERNEHSYVRGPARIGTGGEDELGREYLSVDVDGAELASHLRTRLSQFAADTTSRPALSPSRLREELRRELHRSSLSGRPGMLAVVKIAEWDTLRSRLGPLAASALASAFGSWVADSTDVLEQHCVLAEGGFLVLLPEIGPMAGRQRLLSLSRRVAGTVLDIAGERVRVTPVIGYATFFGERQVEELEEEAWVAAEAAANHLDLFPVQYTRTLGERSATAPGSARDRLPAVSEWLQVAFTSALVLVVPFVVYVLVWDQGFDLTRVTSVLVAVALGITAVVVWIECFRAARTIDVPAPPDSGYPAATAIVAAYLPDEAATIVDTVLNLLSHDYPGDLQVILAYSSPQRLLVEETLAHLAADDPRLLLLRVATSTSIAHNVNAALPHVRGEFVGVFDADHHPAEGSFVRAWRWLADGHDVVQGHRVVRNGEASWVARLAAVEFETVYAVSNPGRSRLHGFGIFDESTGYWRTELLRRIHRNDPTPTEGADSPAQELVVGYGIVCDPGLLCAELAPTTLATWWRERMGWARGSTQLALRQLRPALRSSRLGRREKAGALFLLGWAQLLPWVTVQVLPILAFTAWRERGLQNVTFLIPMLVLFVVYALSVGVVQTVFAWSLSDGRVRRHRWWFAAYAMHSLLWGGELRNAISRVAQLKELLGETAGRVNQGS